MAPKPDEKSGKGSGKGNGKGNGVQKPTKKKPNKKPNDGLFTNTNGDTSFGEEPKLNNPTKTPPYQQGNGPLTPPPDDHNGMMGVRVSSQGPYNYGIRMDHGWTASDGTYEPVPLDKRHKRHVPYPSFINHSWRSMSGLSGLQLAHDAPISLCAMDTVCEHVWKCLPAEVRQYLHMPPPNGPAWWSEDLGPYNDMIKKMEQPIYHVVVDEDGTTEYRFFADIKKRPWIVWPIWVEDQWGSDWLTLIWHSKPSDEAKASNVFGELVSYDIIDFRRDPTVGPDGKHHPLADRRERILERLEDLWTRAGMNFEDAVDLRTGVCPMGLNEATSGERCFAAVKNLLNQRECYAKPYPLLFLPIYLGAIISSFPLASCISEFSCVSNSPAPHLALSGDY
jgi:hypothetical protein